LFSILARLLNKKVRYTAVEVQDGEFVAAVERARRNDWRGANVTIPFKLEAARLAVRLTPTARALGAVNTLRFGRVVTGHNTDAEGLRDACRRAGVKARGKDALIFGAGGAARAAGWALAKDGARSIRFSNRTALTAKKCVRDLAPSFPRTTFSSGAPRNADIWVNATPLGMKGRPDVSPAPKSLRAPETAFDLVYGRRTAFQRHAHLLHARVSDGAAMLVFQALRGWEFWDKPLGARRRALLAERLIKELT
jgi:shikimate dehydrogenase